MNNLSRGNVKYALVDLYEVRKAVDAAILSEPSGEERNRLTEAHILILQAQKILEDLMRP